jgi:Ni,Fe-hydrogenase III small subunit
MQEVDFWSIVPGQPLRPSQIVEVIEGKLGATKKTKKKNEKAGAGK